MNKIIVMPLFSAVLGVIGAPVLPVSSAFAASVEANAQDKFVTVYWDTAGGEKIDPWKVKTDTNIIPPTPTRQNYKFVRWYLTDYGESEVISFEWYKVGENNGAYGDEHFVAIWEPKQGYKDTPVNNPPSYGAGSATSGGSDYDADVDSAEEPKFAGVQFDSSYPFYLTGNYWDARKAAIKTGKALFVLSGAEYCGNTTAAKNYLRSIASRMNNEVVVYYAKRESEGGNAIMHGRLPQYGTYDPRTIDAFTGTIDNEGKFHSNWAWYSGQDNVYGYSYAGWAKDSIDAALNYAANKNYGKFERLVVEGPDAAFKGMTANYKLFAEFSDGTRMEVDHGVKWSVIEGEGTITYQDGTDYAKNTRGVGTLEAKSGSSITIRCRNTFYDFGAPKNVFEKKIAVVEQSDVESLKITTTEFNLEDSLTVQLKCEATLKNGTKAAALPEWKLGTVKVDAYPQGSGLSEVQAPYITVDNTIQNGKLDYFRGRKWTAKDGYTTYVGTDVQDHVIPVTATLNGKTATANVRVWGPSRMWPSKWELVSGDTVAPGSVARVKCTELKYTNKGHIETTTNTDLATFDLSWSIDTSKSKEAYGTTLLEIPADQGNSWNTTLQGTLKLYARKNGGKYTGHDEMNGTAKTLKYNPSWANTYGVSVDGADKDNDGFSNRDEFILGTEPNKAESRWSFLGSHLDWLRSPGRTYTLEGSADEGNTWVELGTAAGEGDLSITNAEAAETSTLFRVRVSYNNQVFVSETYKNTDEADWRAYAKPTALNTLTLSTEEKKLLVKHLGENKSIRTPSIRLNGKTLSEKDAFNAALLFDQYNDSEEDLKFEISEFNPATGKFKFNLNKNLARGRVVLLGCNELGGEWKEVKNLAASECNSGSKELADTNNTYRFYKLALER